MAPGRRIPFHGSERPDLFAIEGRAMDHAGLVTQAPASRLPRRGLVLDVGAGDGFVTRQVTNPTRTVLPLEPAFGMTRTDRNLPWIRGEAVRLAVASGNGRGGRDAAGKHPCSSPAYLRLPPPPEPDCHGE